MDRLTADVIIVTRDRYKKLIRTVQGIVSGKLLPRQLIIIDSSDNKNLSTIYKIRSFTDKHRVQLQYSHIPNKGIAYSRNIGIRKVISKGLAQLDVKL